MSLLKKEYRKQTRRARRAHEKYKKAVFLDRLQRHTPDIHELLRKPRTNQQAPITAEGWRSYLNKHFGAQLDSPSQTNSTAVHMHGMPAPDEMELPDAAALYPTVCSYMRRLNPKTSPGFGAIAAPFIKYAEKRVPAVNGRGTDRINVLAPYVARLFAAMMEKAEIPACWKAAKLTPLHKKGSLLDPANYRMLAVSDIMYRIYANVLRDVVTRWCRENNRIPDTQYGFYPGRNTLQPIFILRHLQHAAQIKRPHSSPRLYAAFIDFKQAYDTIPRDALWTHLQSIRMPSCLLAILKNIYDNDEYILVDGCKRAHVHPRLGVKQGCPLSPLLFSLYINDVDCLAENVSGAVTGAGNFHVTHMLYADDLCLTANHPTELQRMLDRLHGYAQRKGLIINVSKSEVVSFNSKGNNVPVFNLGGEQLVRAESFKYLGMLFTKQFNPLASSEHMCAPFLAGCRRIRHVADEYKLADRPHTMLWLTKTYALPASMYASQIWGTRFMRPGDEMTCPLQTVHLCLLKRILGVKKTTPNWSVLRECGFEPLQFYWFRAAVRFYNASLACNSTTLRRVLGADIDMSGNSEMCWASEFISAFQGLDRRNYFTHCVYSGQPIRINDFVVDLRERHRSVWPTEDQAEHGVHLNKLAKYHNWVALPFRHNSALGKPLHTPRYLHLDLGRHMQRNIACFRLHAHKLRVETSHWHGHAPQCDLCVSEQWQDEKHVIFLCPCNFLCCLRRKYAHLFTAFPAHRVVSDDTGSFFFSDACSLDVARFFQNQDTQTYRFISELMDFFHHTEQPNYLAEGYVPL